MAQEIVEAPIVGKVIRIHVKSGDKVEEGDVLLEVESMKMENPILAPLPGTINEVNVSVEQVVKAGEPLVVIEY